MFTKDFSAKTVKALAKKGISIIGKQYLPWKGSCLNGIDGYVLNDNGTQRIKTFQEVLTMATEK